MTLIQWKLVCNLHNIVTSEQIRQYICAGIYDFFEIPPADQNKMQWMVAISMDKMQLKARNPFETDHPKVAASFPVKEVSIVWVMYMPDGEDGAFDIHSELLDDVIKRDAKHLIFDDNIWITYTNKMDTLRDGKRITTWQHFIKSGQCFKKCTNWKWYQQHMQHCVFKSDVIDVCNLCNLVKYNDVTFVNFSNKTMSP
jgi:hypothetical protein